MWKTDCHVASGSQAEWFSGSDLLSSNIVLDSKQAFDGISLSPEGSFDTLYKNKMMNGNNRPVLRVGLRYKTRKALSH